MMASGAIGHVRSCNASDEGCCAANSPRQQCARGHLRSDSRPSVAPGHTPDAISHTQEAHGSTISAHCDYTATRSPKARQLFRGSNVYHAFKTAQATAGGDRSSSPVKKAARLPLEIVKRSDVAKGFVVLPERWIVEQAFGWLGRCRRLACGVRRIRLD